MFPDLKVTSYEEVFESKVLRLIRVQQGDYKLTKELFEEKMIEVKK